MCWPLTLPTKVEAIHPYSFEPNASLDEESQDGHRSNGLQMAYEKEFIWWNSKIQQIFLIIYFIRSMCLMQTMRSIFKDVMVRFIFILYISANQGMKREFHFRRILA